MRFANGCASPDQTISIQCDILAGVLFTMRLEPNHMLRLFFEFIIWHLFTFATRLFLFRVLFEIIQRRIEILSHPMRRVSG
jgi:hypothetical protein